MSQPVHPLPERLYTEEEYLAFEEASEEKHEYVDGRIIPLSQIIATAGGTADHSLVIANSIREVGVRVKGTPCRVYDSNMRIKVPRKKRYRYPDFTVICNGVQLADEKSRTTALNPRVVFEVLSSSTERTDRTTKFQDYVDIDSLEEHVMVSQQEPRVELLLRQADGTWSLSWATGRDAVLKVRSLKIDVPLADIYDGVRFDASPAVEELGKVPPTP